MAKGLTYRIKTASGERIALYPPKLHTLDQILNYGAYICRAVEKGIISESRAATIMSLLNTAKEVVKLKMEFEKYDEILQAKEKWEED